MAMRQYIELVSPVTQNSFYGGKIKRKHSLRQSDVTSTVHGGVAVAWQLQVKTVRVDNSRNDHRGQQQTFSQEATQPFLRDVHRCQT